MTKLIDITGQVFGRWTVVDYAGSKRWNCVCACGESRAVDGTELRLGRSRACGCASSRYKTPTERFWMQVDKGDDCWLWTGPTDRDGYGRFFADGRTQLAHRFAFAMSGATQPKGMQVDHVCHTPSCVNPAHLRITTAKQNQENRVRARIDSSSGIRGVSWDGRTSRWIAKVTHGGQPHTKTFADFNEAHHWVVATRNELFTHNDADRMAKR